MNHNSPYFRFVTGADGFRQAQARAVQARIDQIYLHAEIARELHASGRRNIRGKDILAELDRRRENEARLTLGHPPRRHGDDFATDDDINRRITEARAFLDRPRQQPRAGASIAEALRHGEDGGRAHLNPSRWSTSVHEAAHGVIAERLAPGSVAHIELHAGGGGACTFAADIPEHRYAIGCAAGAEAQYLFETERTSRMQSGDPRTDGDQFLAALKTHHHADDLDPYGREAAHAANTARQYVEMDRPTIAGLARLLYDTGHVDGEDIRIVMEIRDGKHDHIARDLGLPPFAGR